MIHQKDRQLRRAERELTLAVRVDDTSAASWNQLGMARTGLGNIEDGCKAYRKALSLDPKNVEAWFNLAQARKEVGGSPSLVVVQGRKPFKGYIGAGGGMGGERDATHTTAACLGLRPTYLRCRLLS